MHDVPPNLVFGPSTRDSAVDMLSECQTCIGYIVSSAEGSCQFRDYFEKRSLAAPFN